VQGITIGLPGYSVTNAQVTGNLIIDAGVNVTGVGTPWQRAAIFAGGQPPLVTLIDVQIDGNRIIDDGATLVGHSSVRINYVSANSTVTLSRNRISTRAVAALDYDISLGNAGGAAVVDGGGAHDARPAQPQRWEMYFDTTVVPNGKPLWWNGSAWVDAGGTNCTSGC
jgi:hypothetical protein